VITKHDEKLEIWKEYFSILLNQPALLQRPNIPAASNIPPNTIKATEVESADMRYAVQSDMDNRRIAKLMEGVVYLLQHQGAKK